MSVAPTVHEILSAFADRTERTRTASSTRVEVAAELERPRTQVDPIIDEAIEQGLLGEDPKYKDFWRLTEDGQTALDEQLFI
jgi:hypothetical protein